MVELDIPETSWWFVPDGKPTYWSTQVPHTHFWTAHFRGDVENLDGFVAEGGGSVMAQENG
jgi:hypothetical protein